MSVSCLQELSEVMGSGAIFIPATYSNEAPSADTSAERIRVASDAAQQEDSALSGVFEDLEAS